MSKKLKFIVLYWETSEEMHLPKTIIDMGDHPDLNYQQYTTHKEDDRHIITEYLTRHEVSWVETETAVAKNQREKAQRERSHSVRPVSDSHLREEETRTGYSDRSPEDDSGTHQGPGHMGTVY